MRLLNAEAFIKEPGGTVYSLYYPSVTTFQGLSIKGETTHTTRFRQQPLLNTIDVDTDAEATAALERAMKGGSYGVAFDMEAEESIDPAAQYYYAVFDPEDVDKLVARLQQAAEAVRTAARVAAFFAPITYPSGINYQVKADEAVRKVSFIGVEIYARERYAEGMARPNSFALGVKHPITQKTEWVAVEFTDVVKDAETSPGDLDEHVTELFACFLSDVQIELNWMVDCDYIIHVSDVTTPNAYAFVLKASEWMPSAEELIKDQPIESKE